MDRKKIRIILVISVFILIFTVASTCQNCLAFWAGSVEAVGEETQKALDKIKTRSPEEDREVTWVIEDEEGNPVDENEETGSSQSEDVQDLETYKEGSISLKGKVHALIPGVIELNIDYETSTVEGTINGAGWEEEIIIDDEGSGEDHHHTKKCNVIFNGTFFGKIDKNGYIFANVVGNINGKDGECKNLVKNKSESFILEGKYHANVSNANGSIKPSIKPKGYTWFADKV
jgi:hypothetical protein